MDSNQLKLVDTLLKSTAGGEALNKLKKAAATDLRNETPLTVSVIEIATRLTDTTDELVAGLSLVDRYAVAGVAGAFLQVMKSIKKEG